MLTGLSQNCNRRVSMPTLSRYSRLDTFALKAVKHGTRSPFKTSEELARPTALLGLRWLSSGKIKQYEYGSLP